MVAAVEDLARWRAALNGVLDEIETWARAEGWLVSRQPKEIAHDGGYGPYQADVLTIATSQGQVRVDPVGRFVAGATGRLDLYAWPSLHRFLIVRENDHWAIRTDSGVPWPGGWGKETFLALTQELVRAA